MARIRFSAVGKRYPNGFVALADLNLEIEDREFLVLLGPSGCGKSTLLHLLGTLDHPSSGRVLFDGEDLFERDPIELARFRNESLGFIFQFHHLLPEFDARENVMLPCLISGISWEEAGRRADRLLEEVGLSGRSTHRVGEISGGEQQRVAICRALAMEPAVVLADEPTGNLDKETAAGVMDLLVTLNRSRGMSLIVVTHNEEMAGRMHRVIQIDDGRIAR